MMKHQLAKKIYFSHIALFLFLALVLFLPLILQAQISGFVYECNSGRAGECTFDDLIRAVNNIVNQGTVLAIGFSVVVIAWAGIRYVVSGGNPSERTKATNMLLSVVKGIVIIIAAWAFVRLIIAGLGVQGINTFMG